MGFKETYTEPTLYMGKELSAWAKGHKSAAAGAGVFIGFILLGAVASVCDESIDPSGQAGENGLADFGPKAPEKSGSLELPLESGQVVVVGQNF